MHSDGVRFFCDNAQRIAFKWFFLFLCCVQRIELTSRFFSCIGILAFLGQQGSTHFKFIAQETMAKREGFALLKIISAIFHLHYHG